LQRWFDLGVASIGGFLTALADCLSIYLKIKIIRLSGVGVDFYEVGGI
jgi:hypothetical protein